MNAPPQEPLPGRPRTLLFSQRNVEVHLWEAPQLEFEDVLREVEAPRQVAPALSPRGGGFLTRGRNFLGRGIRYPHRWPVERTPIEDEYELFFATYHFPKNISLVDCLPGVRERCRTMACHLIELWSPDVVGHRRELLQLRQFDHIFVTNGSVAEALQELVQRPVHVLPTATDVLRFSPYPEPPGRCVDVYNYGRGSEDVHRQLHAMAEAGEIFYLHARVNHQLMDYRAHRVQVANIMKRSRYFFAYRVTENRRLRTGGDESLITRHFEAAAGGAVMLGSHPHCPEWHEYFDWAEPLIPIPWDPPDLRALLRELDANPERLERISRENAVQSLRRHDWVHRWGRVLDTVGLPHTAAMHDRTQRLAAIADAAAAGLRAPLDTDAIQQLVRHPA